MASDQTAAAVRALVRSAPPLDWRRVIDGARDLLLPVLRHADPPDGLVDAVLASGEGVLLEALAGNETMLRDAGLAARLADTGRPEVARGARVAYGDEFWRRLLSAAPPDGEPTAYVDSRDWSKWVLTGLRSAMAFAPFPDLYRLALSGQEYPLYPLALWERLTALSRMYDIEGPDAVREHVKAEQPEFAEPVLAALDAGCHPSELAAEAMAPDAVVEVLYDKTDPRRREYLERLPELAWDRLMAAHAERPFDDDVVARLVSRHDVPDAAVLALARTHPDVVVTKAVRVTEELWDVLPGGSATAKKLAVRLREDGATGGFLDRARPAATILSAVEHNEATRDALRRLVADTLGSDVDAWWVLRSLLGRFKGTITELFEETAKRLAAGERRGDAWPQASELPAFGKKAAPSGPRAAFLTLLDAAPVEAHLALLPVVDDRTAHDLFVNGSWRPEWLDHVLDKGTREQRIALASRGALSTRDTQRLVGLDDPLVDARLFSRTSTSTEQRAQILGRPLDPEFRAWLLTRTAGWRPRDAVGCADLEVQRHVLAHSRVRGMVPQMRMLFDVWERHGAATVRDYLDGDLGPGRYEREPFIKPVVKKLRTLLEAPDEAAAKDELRRYLAERETGAWQVARLRKVPEYSSFNEDHAWQWDELLAAHLEEPLPQWVVAGLNAEPSCPEDLANGNDTKSVVRPLIAGEVTVEEFLAALFQTEGPQRAAKVIDHAERKGLLTREQVIEQGRPAATAVALAGRGGIAQAAEVNAVLSTLADEYLGTDPEAWILALRMLPDFAGTLPELLRTAALTV